MGVFPEEMEEVEIDGVTRRIVRSRPGVPMKDRWQPEDVPKFGLFDYAVLAGVVVSIGLIFGRMGVLQVIGVLLLFTAPCWMLYAVWYWDSTAQRLRILRWPLTAVALGWGVQNELWMTLGRLLWAFITTDTTCVTRPGYC